MRRAGRYAYFLGYPRIRIIIDTRAEGKEIAKGNVVKNWPADREIMLC